MWFCTCGPEDTSYGGLEESRCCCSARSEFTEVCPIGLRPLVSAVVLDGTDFSDFNPGVNIMSSLISHALEIITHGQKLIICALELITNVPQWGVFFTLIFLKKMKQSWKILWRNIKGKIELMSKTLNSGSSCISVKYSSLGSSLKLLTSMLYFLLRHHSCKWIAPWSS